jgi:thiol:disulfide interchange protein DsbD
MALGALEALPSSSGLLARFGKGTGVILLAYGILLLIGAASNGADPFHPLEKLSIGPREAKVASDHQLAFIPIHTIDELDEQLQNAARLDQSVMLDFYADWCTACQEMEEITFQDPVVQKTLSHVILLKADVTQQTDEDRSLQKRFGLIGPPATLFFRNGNQEVTQRRIVGFMEPSNFNNHVIASIGPVARSISP